MENKTQTNLIKKYTAKNRQDKVNSILQFSRDLELAREIVKELQALRAKQQDMNRIWQEAGELISLYRENFGNEIFKNLG